MDSIRTILKSDFETRRANRPEFSLRSYARFLGVNPTSLSLFLNKKRNFSKKAAQKILSKIFHGDSKLFLIDEMENHKVFTQIDSETLDMTSDWYYFAILSLAETNEFKAEPAWIAKRLNLKTPIVERAIKRLIRFGMLKSTDRSFEVTGKQFKTSDHIASLAVRRSHFQSLELARRSLEKDGLERRNFSAMTMSIDPKRIPTANQRIKDFRRKLCRFLEGGDKKEVYRLCIQLFPLTEEL